MTVSIQSNPVQGGRPFDPATFIGATAIATVLNLLIFWVGKSAGAAMTLESGAYDTITWTMVGSATLVALALGGMVTWIVSPRWPAFFRIALWGGLAVALVSLASPFLVADDIRTAVSLAAMHVVGATAWFFGLRSTRR